MTCDMLKPSSPPEGRAFRYSFGVRAFMTFGTLLFVMAAIGTTWAAFTQEGGWRELWWCVLLYVGLAASCGVLAFLVSGTLLIDAEAVSQIRFGKVTRIEFRDVIKMEHRYNSGRFVIHSRALCKIIVEKQLKKFPEFETLLESAVPDQLRQPIPDLPLTCPVQTAMLMIWRLFAVAGAAAIVAGLALGNTEAATIGGLALNLFGAFLALSPRSFTFAKDTVSVKSLLLTKSYLVDDLANIRLTRKYMPFVHQDISSLHLKFRKKTLVITELTIAYSVELLLRTLEHHYFVSAVECDEE